MPHSSFSKKNFSFLSSPFSTPTSVYLIAALSFPPITIPKPSSQASKTKSSKLSRILWAMRCFDLSLYSIYVGLCFVVFCDVGLVDRHCWWSDLVFYDVSLVDRHCWWFNSVFCGVGLVDQRCSVFVLSIYMGVFYWSKFLHKG